MPRNRPGRLHAPVAARLCLSVAALLSLTGCGVLTETPPAPTPADFQGIAMILVQNGIRLDHVVSGEPGCDDIDLARTAIAVDAAGLDQASPTRVYLYIFRNRSAFERLHETVDVCARSYVTDPDAFESFDASPYVVTGAGPWAPEFRSTLRAAITEAAGTGD
jgi:hypothetical protein